MNLSDLAAYIGALLNDDIFGIGRYLNADVPIDTLEVTRPKDIEGHISAIIEKYGIEDDGTLEQAFVEILTNAIYYGVLDEDGAKKEDGIARLKLSPVKSWFNAGKRVTRWPSAFATVAAA